MAFFNAAEELPAGEFGVIPPGEYTAIVKDSVLKDTKTGGKMLSQTFEIIEGNYAKRLVWNNLNMVNASEQAQSIAHRQFRDFCVAAGMGDFKVNTPEELAGRAQELHYKPVIVELGIEKSTGYPDKNKVVKFKKATAQFAPANTAPASGAPPWAKSAA